MIIHKPIEIYTIGFTEKNASSFFRLLESSGASHLIDVRLNNSSQLAGFAKKNDLEYFLKRILNWRYSHRPELAPTKDILDEYKKNNGKWFVYEEKFINLMEKRMIENSVSIDEIQNGVLLCSENLPHFCHRRLVSEYLKNKWKIEVVVKHLY
jgi:uncharacterized protein (DUF488 family)